MAFSSVGSNGSTSFIRIFFPLHCAFRVKRRKESEKEREERDKKQVIRVTRGWVKELKRKKRKENIKKKKAISRVRVSSSLYAICLAFVCQRIHYVS